MSENTGNVESVSTEGNNTEVQGSEGVSGESTQSQEQEGQENVSEGVKAKIKAEKEKPAPQKKKFKLKVDNEEIEEEIDLNDEQALIRELQKAKAFERRAADLKKEKAKAFDIVKQFEQDPASILKRLGPKGREAAEKFLLEQIQDDMLTPEQKKYREMESKIKSYEERELQAKKQAEEKAIAEYEAKIAQDFQSKIINGLEKSGLPKSPELVKKMAGLLKKNLALGLDLSAEDLAVELKKDVLNTVKAITKDSDGDLLVSLFGEEVANKIRKSDLKKLQEKQAQVFGQSTPSPSVNSSNADTGRPKFIDEWKAELEKRFG